jgi:hypothetical protein
MRRGTPGGLNAQVLLELEDGRAISRRGGRGAGDEAAGSSPGGVPGGDGQRLTRVARRHRCRLGLFAGLFGALGLRAVSAVLMRAARHRGRHDGAGPHLRPCQHPHGAQGESLNQARAAMKRADHETILTRLRGLAPTARTRKGRRMSQIRAPVRDGRGGAAGPKNRKTADSGGGRDDLGAVFAQLSAEPVRSIERVGICLTVLGKQVSSS